MTAKAFKKSFMTIGGVQSLIDTKRNFNFSP